ncbi:MAG: hypothetical protein V1866_04160 [archaeon]
MKKRTRNEVFFVLVVLGLILLLTDRDISVNGRAIQDIQGITLVSPSDNTQTKNGNIFFTFKYNPETSMKSCSLMIDEKPARIMDTLLSAYSTRMQAELAPGEYHWGIACIDSDDFEIKSERRNIIILPEGENPIQVDYFFNKPGTKYTFELKENLDLNLENLVPNDVIIAKRDKSSYETTVLRINQDYSKDTDSIELMIMPGTKRVKINRGESLKVDFNNDGLSDVTLTLVKVSYKRAFLNIRTD